MRAYFAFCFYAASLLLSVAFTSLAIRLGKRLNLADMPGVRKVHREPIPRIGGLAVYLSIVLLVLPALLLVGPTSDASRQTQSKMWVLLLGATTVCLLGLADDIKALRARLKLLVQFAAATLVYWGGIRIGSIAVAQWTPVDLGWLAWPLTVLWIVGITNAVNLSDGVDGLATGVSMIACGVIAILAVRSDQMPIALLMVAVLGALTGFLCFNFYPARIFLGDSGSLFLGFIIAATSVLCFMESHAFAALALPAVALGVPILDTVLSVVRRFVARRPIFAPDRGHFHHRLLHLGLGQRRVVSIVYGSTLLAVCPSLLMLSADARTSLVLFAGVFVSLFALFHAVGVVRLRTVVAGLQSRLHLSHQAREEISEFCDLQLQFDGAQSPRAWWQALCHAANQLDFAWISVDITDSEGNTETHLWRRSKTPPPSARVTIVRVPVRGLLGDTPIEVEVAVLTNGSIEGAARRASLFGRLMDEYRMPAFDRAAEVFAKMTRAPGPGKERPTTSGIATCLDLSGSRFGRVDSPQEADGGRLTTARTSPGPKGVQESP